MYDMITKNNTTFGEKYEIKYNIFEKNVFLCENVMLFYCYVGEELAITIVDMRD